MEIARWTTPSISYKPSMVQASDVVEIKCVLTQNGTDLIVKDINSATLSEGRFVWTLTQEESASLAMNRKAYLQFDFLTNGGDRYTTVPKEYEIVNSAIDGAI